MAISPYTRDKYLFVLPDASTDCAGDIVPRLRSQGILPADARAEDMAYLAEACAERREFFKDAPATGVTGLPYVDISGLDMWNIYNSQASLAADRPGAGGYGVFLSAEMPRWDLLPVSEVPSAAGHALAPEALATLTLSQNEPEFAVAPADWMASPDVALADIELLHSRNSLLRHRIAGNLRNRPLNPFVARYDFLTGESSRRQEGDAGIPWEYWYWRRTDSSGTVTSNGEAYLCAGSSDYYSPGNNRSVRWHGEFNGWWYTDYFRRQVPGMRSLWLVRLAMKASENAAYSYKYAVHSLPADFLHDDDGKYYDTAYINNCKTLCKAACDALGVTQPGLYPPYWDFRMTCDWLWTYYQAPFRT